MALRWVFTADTGPFRRGLDQMRTEAKGFTNQLSKQFRRAFAFLSGAGLVATITTLTRRLKELDLAANRLNVDVRFVQDLELLATKSNVQLDNMVEFLQDINEKAIDAAAGSGEAGEAFKMLNINAEEFLALDLRGQLLAYADAVANASDRQTALAATMKIGSDEAARLIPTLAMGSDGILEMTSEMQTFGEESAIAMRLAREEMDLLGLSAKNMGTEMVGGVTLVFRGVFNALHDLWKDMGKLRPEMTLDDLIDSYLHPYQQLIDEARQIQIGIDAGITEGKKSRVAEAERRAELREVEAEEMRAERRRRELEREFRKSDRGTRTIIPPDLDSSDDPFENITGSPDEEALRRWRMEFNRRHKLDVEPDFESAAVTTSLQSIGGGTAGGGTAQSIAQRGLQLASLRLAKLNEIAQNTSKGENGTENVAEPRVP